MAPRPAYERPPTKIGAHWTRVWDGALKVLKDQGTWSAEQKPLLDEYVLALKEVADAREAAAGEPYKTSVHQLLHAHPGWQQADRSLKRALALAEVLVLTPKAQDALLGEDDGDDPDDDQAGL